MKIIQKIISEMHSEPTNNAMNAELQESSWEACRRAYMYTGGKRGRQ